MTTRLNGRVRSLERQARHAAGCPTCGGWGFHILEPGEEVPAWLDEQSRCRACGRGVKGIHRNEWDRL